MSLLDNNGLSYFWGKIKSYVGGQLPSDFTGATTASAGAHGLVPAPTTTDTEKFLRGDGSWGDGGKPMVVLSYGSSTWSDFIDAYKNNVIVYCRASSNSNPATGAQNRMAFMAYVNDAINPTNVEFQYYRSVSSHSATQQGDQVYVYKLDKTAGWTVTVRESYTKIIGGTNTTTSYNNGALTINATDTDTWRNISVNGVEKLGTAKTTGSVGFINGLNTTVTYNDTNRTIQIDTDGGTPTDEKVAQNATTANANYRVLLSGSADDTDHTEGAYKNSGLLFNTNKQALRVGNVNTTTMGQNSFANGSATVAKGASSHAEGYGTTAFDDSCHTEGENTYANGWGAHAEGENTYADGNFTHVEGYGTTANNNYAHAEGSGAIAAGLSSHAEGNNTTASGFYAHSEGYNTYAYGSNSHAEGTNTYAQGYSSHAEGYYTTAMNTGHSEGFNTYVKGYASHTEGYYTTASGSYSHAEGKNTIATHQSQHVFGEYNTLDASTATTGRGNYIEIVGNGVNASTTSNARTLDWDGNEVLAGNITLGSGKDILLPSGDTWDGTNTSIKTAFSEIKSNLTYKLVDSKEGATSINLPASFKKLLVHVSDGAWVNFSIELLPSMLDSNGKYFGAGAYFSSNSYNSCLVLATTTTVTLNNLTEGGTNKTSSGVTTVYYR